MALPKEEWHEVKPGAKIGKWNVIGNFFSKKIKAGKDPRYERYVEVRCDCGREKNIRVSTLRYGLSLSCGCNNYTTRSPDPEIASVRHVLTYTRSGANKRGIPFELTSEDLRSLIFKPCTYCGGQPAGTRPRGSYSNGMRPYHGVDRVDSSKGYALDNVVPCCSQCNTMKLDLSMEEFRDHVARVHATINNQRIDGHRRTGPRQWKFYDGMVILADWMGGDLSVVNAARVSFNKQVFSLEDKDRKLIRYLADHKHMSPFRHVQVQLILQNIPEFVLRQLYKHQVGISYTAGDFREAATVWNEVSGRYVEFDYDFFEPVSFRPQHEENKQASYKDRRILNEEDARELYREAIRRAWDGYRSLLDLNVCKEQARMILPLAFNTSVIWTASLESLVHFVRLRNHPGAQVETQELAMIVDKIVREIAPISTAALLGEDVA